MDNNHKNAMVHEPGQKAESDEEGKMDRRAVPGNNGNHDPEKSFYNLKPGDLIVVRIIEAAEGGYAVRISDQIAGFLQTERSLTVGMGLVARFISMRDEKPLLTLEAAKE